MNDEQYNNFCFHVDERNIATISLDVPGHPLNILNESVISELDEIIREIENSNSIKIVIFQSGKFDVIVTLNEDKTLDQMALQLASNTLVIGVHEWFKADLDLQRDFKLFCKTNKYLVVHGAGGQTGGRAQTNQSFKLRNEDLKASILQSLKSKFSETRFVSQQRVMESNEVAGASA